ncbi:MAG: hypothetical protein RLZZ253_1856 [Verrucomicrobiota bacterium]|jgi:hypothetical protein
MEVRRAGREESEAVAVDGSGVLQGASDIKSCLLEPMEKTRTNKNNTKLMALPAPWLPAEFRSVIPRREQSVDKNPQEAWGVSVGVADAFDVRQEAAICLRALAEFEQQPTGIL